MTSQSSTARWVGVALLDYDNDGYLDIFFTNGASIPGLNKSNRTFSNRLFHNNRDGTFTDVTERAGVSGEGYSMGAAAADYDNDGWTDLYVTGVNRNILYHNNHDEHVHGRNREGPSDGHFRREEVVVGIGCVGRLRQRRASLISS